MCCFLEVHNAPGEEVSVPRLHGVRGEHSQPCHLAWSPPRSCQDTQTSLGPGMPYAPSTVLPLTLHSLAGPETSCLLCLAAPPLVCRRLTPSHHSSHCLDITSSGLSESLASLFPTSDHCRILHSTKHS